MHPCRLLVALVVLPAALMACSDAPDSAIPDTAGPARTDLVVEVRLGPGAAPTRTTLTCDPPGGDHPDPAAACAALAREPDPFVPLPADAICTEIYGGPETATVTGTYAGRPVALTLSRTDGCRIAQWDRLGALLPSPGS